MWATAAGATEIGAYLIQDLAGPECWGVYNNSADWTSVANKRLAVCRSRCKDDHY